MSIRVLVADDQSLVRSGFQMLLAGEPDIEIVAEASNGPGMAEKAARFQPTVALMDIPMPELDGLEATRRILAADEGARVPVITTFDLDEYVFEALRIGASGFVLKDEPPEQLLAAIRTIAAAATRCSRPDHEARDRAVHAAPADRRRRRSTAHRLGARDLPPDRQRPLERAEIGQKLYISDVTVKTHVTHLFQKLDVRDRVQAVVLAYQAGLVERGPAAGSLGVAAERDDRVPEHPDPLDLGLDDVAWSERARRIHELAAAPWCR